MFNRLAINAGLEVRKFGRPSEVRYRFHAHELRDTFRTACTVAGIAYPVCEFLIGHEIDKMHYDKSPSVYPEHFRVEYMKVEPYVNVFSNQAVGIEKLERLEAEIAELRKTNEKYQKIKDSAPLLEKLLRRVEELEKRLGKA